jgi:hypothetical protein
MFTEITGTTMTFMVKMYWLITLVGTLASLALSRSYPVVYGVTALCLFWAVIGCYDM